jgi:uncharacterized RDD family membrane protein YckC
MRCPKCQYLGFDGHERCRNCGYDLSLSQTLPPEQTLAPESSAGAPGANEAGLIGAPDGEADLLLRPEPTARERARAAIQRRQAAARPGGDPFDLPLFAGAPEAGGAEPPAARVESRPPMSRAAEARPFVSASPTPRPPLSVRRATSEPPRARGGAAMAPAQTEPGLAAPTETSAPAMSLDVTSAPPSSPFDVDELPISLAPPSEASLPETSLPDPSLSRTSPSNRSLSSTSTERASDPLRHDRLALDARAEPSADAETEDRGVPSRVAPIRARLIGGLIDAGILGAIDFVVLAFTLRLTGVAWSDIERLPLMPLAAFLALLATGYLAMFTVLAGQTAGQMAVGIRVVETDGRPVRFGHAVLRAAVQVATVPLLGLGFLPALLASDRRTLYDRLSETEVVRGDD